MWEGLIREAPNYLGVARVSEESRKELRIGDIHNIWLEYDKQTDILYINFGTDIEDADESVMVDDDIIVRIKNGRVVSITIMNFSEKAGIPLF